MKVIQNSESPIESRNGDDVTRIDTELHQTSRDAQNSFDELHPRLAAVAVDGDNGIAVHGGQPAQALTNVSFLVVNHGCGVLSYVSM